MNLREAEKLVTLEYTNDQLRDMAKPLYKNIFVETIYLEDDMRLEEFVERVKIVLQKYPTGRIGVDATCGFEIEVFEEVQCGVEELDRVIYRLASNMVKKHREEQKQKRTRESELKKLRELQEKYKDEL